MGATPAEVDRQLKLVAGCQGAQRHDLAASLSKVAAKAEDPVLLQLGDKAKAFVTWLDAEEPLVRAYTACILANIAFLEAGQMKVLDAGGVPPLVALLKSKDDKKVTLHATAAIQNLTYKNTACCQSVLEQGGEKALKKLLQHKSEDVQQFAAGALANLQLYRRAAEESQAAASTPLAPPIGNKKGGGSLNRKVKNILRRRSADEQPRGGGGDVHQQEDAALCVQAAFRGMKGRQESRRKREKANKKKNRYQSFNVNEVRNELDRNEYLPPLPSQLRKLPMPGAPGLPMPGGLNAGAGGRLPARLAPLGELGGNRLPPLGSANLPPLQPGVRAAPGLPMMR